MAKYSKIGKINDDFDVVQLKSVLVKNDAGDWGNEPDNSAIGIIRSTNFNNDGKLDLTNVAYRTLSTRKFEEKKLFASDILVERSGGSETQPVGRVGYITEEIAKSDFAFANFIQRISVDETVDSKFIYYCLQHLYEMGITSGMQTQTTGIRNLDWKQYIGTYLPKPSLPEQASIANILSSVDEAIESVKKSIEAAEKLKKSLMQNLLTGRMKPDGTFRTEEEFYEDEKFGKVPIGWEVKKLGNLFHIKAGGDLQENFYSPIYDEQHKCPIFSNTIENSGLYGYTSNPRFISKESLTIVGRGVGVGHVEYRKGNYDAIIRLISLIPKQEDAIDCMYVNYYICQYVHFAIESTGVPQLTCPKVFSTKIIIPKNVFEQSQIAEKIHCIDIDIKIKQTQITTLERLKKSLMQNLLTGKVRVGKEGKYQNRRV